MVSGGSDSARWLMPDIGALGEDGREVDPAEWVVVREDLRADLDVARRRINDAVVVIATGLNAGRHEERLDAGTGLEDVGHRPVAVVGRIGIVAIVGVEARLIDHRQDFSGPHIDHDHGAGFRTLIAHRSLQFPVGQILQTQVDRTA